MTVEEAKLLTPYKRWRMRKNGIEVPLLKTGVSKKPNNCVCEVCGKGFHRPPSHCKLYCSRNCSWEVRRTGKLYKKKGRRDLYDFYVKKLIYCAGMKNPSQELISIWRETLLVKRAARKVQEALDERTS